MGLFTLPQMEKRDIVFDPIPHTYVDNFGSPYTSVTTLVGKVIPKYDAEFWAMYRAIDQVPQYRPYPHTDTREIEIFFNGHRQRFSIEFLYSGIIPTEKTPEQITAEWKAMTEESCDWGNDRHEYLEGCVNAFSHSTGVPFHDIKERTTKTFAFKVTNLKELENSPLKFTYPTIYAKIEKYIKEGWVAYAEKRVYSAYHLIAGTIDLLLVRGKQIIILDWKTNKAKLKFVPGYYKKQWLPDRSQKVKTDQWVSKNDKLLYPLNHVPDCKGMLYTMQLSLYSAICELWGFEPVGCVLCHIRPELDQHKEPRIVIENGIKKRVELPPEFYKIDYLREEAFTLLNWHINNVIN